MTQIQKADLIAKRGELMAELFLQELGPLFVSRPTNTDVGYDLLVGFANEKAGVNTFAVEVKSTEQLDKPEMRLPRRAFDKMVHSNVPAILLVADVKQNRLYYSWLRESRRRHSKTAISVPVVQLDQATKDKLVRELTRAEQVVSALV